MTWRADWTTWREQDLKMTDSHSARMRKAEGVRRRLASPMTSQEMQEASACAVLGCKRPTMRAEGKGLSLLLCRYHHQFKARHGSAWRKTFSRAELAPYRQAADLWLAANQESHMVQRGLAEIEALLAAAGPAYAANQLHRMKPEARARAALARLRKAKVRPQRVMREYLVVMSALQDGKLRKDGSEDFELVQIAKPLHRLASGYRVPGTSKGMTIAGAKLKTEWFAESRGNVMRHVGRMVRAACRHGVTHHEIADVLAGVTEERTSKVP